MRARSYVPENAEQLQESLQKDIILQEKLISRQEIIFKHAEDRVTSANLELEKIQRELDSERENLSELKF